MLRWIADLIAVEVLTDPRSWRKHGADLEDVVRDCAHRVLREHVMSPLLMLVASTALLASALGAVALYAIIR